MRIADILTPNPITIEPDARLDRAIAAMEAHDCRHLLVATHGKLVGVLSDRDLLAATGWVVEAGDSRPVSDVMTRKPKTADPRTEVVAAAILLELDSIGCLPVIDEERIVGIVTETDFAAAWLETLEAGALDAAADPRVETVMSRKPIVVSPADSVLEARIVAQTHRIRHLPVVEGNRLLGVISDRDIRRAEGRHRLREAVLAGALEKRTRTIEPSARLSLATTLMLDAKIGCLPVVLDTKLVGIVTMTDVLDHCVNTLWRPERLPAPRD